MGLVEYSSSSEDDNDDIEQHTAKRRKLLDENNLLPPLPSNFRDLYSSTVRTSTQDDPSLHGGRKRVTPHVAGNWPAHVYLEWTPEKNQQIVLENLVSSIQDKETEGKKIHTLLENDLGVQLPLHISLSRPLTLKTAQKDKFLADLKTAISTTGVRGFAVTPNKLTWHPNEDGTRWFLVLSLIRPENNELQKLLDVCNKLAGEAGQPLLYQGSKSREVDDGKFHLSVAWSLTPQEEGEVDVATGIKEKLKGLKIELGEVKARIGQDVTSIPLRKRRGALFGRED
ncbi:uncharacterized protein RCC_03655 [Ramularia collo-cygni]|uniref:U6 snRNA phosphodiesterase n=1 Tax=Ramularia collo-cygni TaxID=112498 RepID=A0A2D3V8J9_9PEZI|nr:uncharacterized protein RCC_03655 [Ramularia collo-cygni]CZT17819.1 uncharacterized protein RCC_03655 [Ramularia collo-cygni]